ncbi:DUF7557 family protein [Halorussus salinus]|uniref:DUF7557 family protein n=1 Tax=Halorussus salinus TaxID=1364935 RepID=UPI0010922654|nr:antitoxin VapB family protein [Halorussus salinus]
MSATIPITEGTKDRLSRMKEEDETWDELLRRLADEEAPINVGAWSTDEAEKISETVKRSREGFEHARPESR